MNLATVQNQEFAERLTRFLLLATVALLVTILSMGQVHAADILAPGATTVNETFGAGSTFAKWLILGEVIFGVFMYIKTKNLLLLGGVVVVIVFTTIGFNLAT